jgi:hypothetical protein
MKWKLFYEREETQDTIKITYRNYPIYTTIMYAGALVILFCWAYRLPQAQVIASILLVGVIVFGLIYSGVNREIFEAEKERRAVKSGKKNSFKNPYTVVITRKKAIVEKD